jgi:2,4-dienoyl-CoA reductase (NADPH2)
VVPGKHEFNEMLRYFRVRLQRLGVEVRLGACVDSELLARAACDEIVIATGVKPRVPEIAGIDHPKVVSYVDVLTRRIQAGRRVAIIGAGGIGFDVAEFLLGDADESRAPDKFMSAWHVDPSARTGGLHRSETVRRQTPNREVHMFQRKADRLGARLGKTTGWILKARLQEAGVQMIAGASYIAIDAAGLHYCVSDEIRVLDVDSVVLCAGQESERGLFEDLKARGIAAHLIGGADVASELDAARAIEQATRLALEI